MPNESNAEEFIPLFAEDEDTIRERMDSDRNAGLEPTDPAWTDVRQGSMFRDNTQPAVLELARLYDMVGTVMPAAGIIPFSWGTYLDYHGETYGVTRKPGSAATGQIVVSAAPGITIYPNTTFSVESDDETHPEYISTEEVVTSSALSAPTVALDFLALEADADGTFEVGTYYYRVSYFDPFTGGESAACEEISIETESVGSIQITLTDPEINTIRIYRGTESGLTRLVSHGWLGANNDYTVHPLTDDSYIDHGDNTVSATAAPVGIESYSGKASVPVQCTEIGSIGNTGAGTVTNLVTPLEGISYVTNIVSIVGGAEVESDEAYRNRLVLSLRPSGAGNVADYVRWASSIPDVGRVQVVPVWDGPGTVRVIVMDIDGGPVSTEVVDAVLDYLDPVPGQGAGIAPIGAVVSVATPVDVPIEVEAELVLEPNFSFDGGISTTAIRDDIVRSLSEYINSLESGDTVVYKHVQAALFVAGVYDVTTLAINGDTVDIETSNTEETPEIPRLSTVTLSVDD